ncbi:MAG: hypothetical protein ACKVOR_10135 [Flavobacteriales bacterium]
MHQLNKFFVNFWLTFAIASFIYASYMVWKMGWHDAANNFVIPGIALLWWYFRRYMTQRMERNMREGEQRMKENQQ